MSREKLVKRYLGSETEYGYTLPPGGGVINLHLVPKGVRNIGQFLENGARIYGDVGFLEYATPECPTLEDLVTHELAGEDLLWDAYGGGNSAAITIHKRSLGPNGINSSGSHENLSTSVDLWSGTPESTNTILALASHFATRTVFTGAGRPTRRGLALGQKMRGIDVLSGTGATANKALVNTRNEPHAGGSSLRRLHIVCGDANVSPWAIRMKFGTTSLVLRLIEHGVDLSDIFLADPLGSAHRVAESVTNISKPLKMVSGKTMTALDIQEEFANRTQKLSQRIDLPIEEREVISDWFSVISNLKEYARTGDHQVGMEELDWYIKKELLRRQSDEMISRQMTKKDQVTQRRALDLRYDRVPDGTGFKLRKSGKSFATHTPSDEKLMRARTTPPEGRAKLRGAVIVELTKRKPKNGESRDIGWEYYNINGRQQRIGPIDGRYTDDYVQNRVSDLI